MSSLSSNPSNYQNVATVLDHRGFRWKSIAMQKVQSQSCFLSFEDEWEKFISCVIGITGSTLRAHDATTSKWNCFEHVISPSEGHDDERSFSFALFEALRNSLNDFIDSNLSSTSRIALKNSPIRFGKGFYRTKMGFFENYVLSKDSETDHCCFVMAMSNDECQYDDMTAVVELKLERTSCLSFDVKSGVITKPEFIKWHGPMAQAMIYSMDVWHCLARRGCSVKDLPVVVLAGRGKSRVKKRNLDEMRDSSNKSPICGLEAHVRIPAYCGNTFYYTVDRIVNFSEYMVNARDRSSMSSNSSDGRAIAIYIRAMRIGLERAVDIITKKTIPKAPPVSLCCRQLLRRCEGAQLVACPIPHANQCQESGIVVHLGELFALVSPRKIDFAGLLDPYWFVDSTDNAILTDSCLVKVNCLSVHNFFVRLVLCKEALIKLHGACEKNAGLKEVVSKVLLGFSATDNFSLVFVMNDLRHDKFMILDHQKLRHDKKLSELWAAFCSLVKRLLLPMAATNVIHSDIRSTVKTTYNILYRLVTTDETESLSAVAATARNVIELRLIDFDSLLLYSSIKDANLNHHDHTIHWEDLTKPPMLNDDDNEVEVTSDAGDESKVTIDEGKENENIIRVEKSNELSEDGENEDGMIHVETTELNASEDEDYWGSAYKYLFWQILWIVYTWHPYATESATTDTFVSHFLSDNDQFFRFREWLGADVVKIIRNLSLGEIGADTIELAVEILMQASWTLDC